MLNSKILNIGCGADIRENCINIDIQNLPGVDIVCNAWQIPLEDNYAEYIIAQHILEYIPRGLTIRTLTEWVRVLQPQHHFEIRVADLTQLTKALYLNNISPEIGLPHEMVISLLYGTQRNNYDIKFNGFTSEFFQGILVGMGLRIVSIVTENYDIIITAKK